MRERRVAIQEVERLENEIRAALQRGDSAAAGLLWQRILDLAPDHPKALQALSQRAFAQGDPARARLLLERLVQVDGRDQQQWLNLAVVCQALGDDRGEEAALHGALVVDPQDMLALILKGNLMERRGKPHEAARAFGAAARVAPPLAQVNPQLRPALERAMAFREDYDRKFSAFLEDYLAPHLQQTDGADTSRFRDSVEIMFGRKRRYESQSAIYHYPGLLPLSFYPRASFPWLDEIEARTDAIRAEFLQVLEEDHGFMPYLTYSDDVPLHQWGELNNSPRWSAFHLYQNGKRIEENAARCPRTMEALALAPLPQQAGRTPSAMFSLLKPHTRIPPHSGVSNSRLLAHLPLIVPEGCGFRVGNDTRAWEEGRAWVFDDTIEHEAWNDSDRLRVVLIFDLWHPALSQQERALVSALTAGIEAFAAGDGYGL